MKAFLVFLLLAIVAMATALPQRGQGSQVHVVDGGQQVQFVDNSDPSQVQFVDNTNPGQVQFVDNANPGQVNVADINNDEVRVEDINLPNSVNFVDNNGQQVNNNRPGRPRRPGQFVISNPDSFFGQPSSEYTYIILFHFSNCNKKLYQ
ncbi:uncharacterized protein LOC113503560 isoform X1 [Trichoplusia ni]|uniref:Uncharacterized protein LOC113503560 isoform X1 n=1 Tax=Trichoplusia ni TaxID=7111 RepID=A0A7E5WL27_TRINI|nr:uncharacterized protein LOC113503560 isoform X1 [Trichoplusia ni]